MVARRILIKASSLQNGDVQAALIKDDAPSQDDIGDGITEMCDDKRDDFAAIRNACKQHGLSYDFNQRRDGDGDNDLWYLCRHGTETVSNHGLGMEGVAKLEDCDA